MFSKSSVSQGIKSVQINQPDQALQPVFDSYLSAPLHMTRIRPASSLTTTDIRFRVLLNSNRFRILYSLPMYTHIQKATDRQMDRVSTSFELH
jgi:hypothetical protein